MRIAKIKNRYMFNSSKPNGTHDYLIYEDKRTNEIRAIELTHLYKPDKHRLAQVKSGLLKKMLFKHRETPTGVNNGYLNKNAIGKPIDLNHKDVNMNIYRKVRISKKQQADILKFARKKKR